MIAREPLRLAAARLAADYVWRAQAWACDVDEELVVDLEQVHQRILERIHRVSTLDSEDAVVQARVEDWGPGLADAGGGSPAK